ncbi:MAG: cation diffusion facilitator family transporter [Halobacteriota archaeon]
MNTNRLPPSRELRALQFAVAIYVFLFALKLGAYFLTGVLALLAESVHSLTDIVIALFVALALVYSHKTADEGHRYGHARAQNVAAVVAATLFISFTSVQLYEEAYNQLIGGVPDIYQHLPLATGVVVLSMIVEVVPLILLWRTTKRGPAATAQLTDLVNDELALFAVFVGTVFLTQGVTIADPIAVIIVATVIAVRGVILLIQNASYLLGRSPDAAFLARAARIAKTVNGVKQVHELRGEYIGPDMVHLELHVAVAPDASIKEAHRIADEVQNRLVAEAECQYCMVHPEPAPTP